MQTTGTGTSKTASTADQPAQLPHQRRQVPSNTATYTKTPALTRVNARDVATASILNNKSTDQEQNQKFKNHDNHHLIWCLVK
jgi:hypothetical protein